MHAADSGEPRLASVWKRQVVACGAFAVLLGSIIAVLYVQHRHREWLLRREQTQRRLDVAYEIISKEISRVRADVRYLASRQIVRATIAGDTSRRDELTNDFVQFLRQKALYDQIRVINLDGMETLRVNFAGTEAIAVPVADLQDKSDRYYFREAHSLAADDVLVSEFDLNQEHGSIERPLKPVIRFVARVNRADGDPGSFLALNYLGSALLAELDDDAVPGHTLLVRQDGHYIRAARTQDAWGWLLDHDRTFAAQFPNEWSQLTMYRRPQLTAQGMFAAKVVPLSRSVDAPTSDAITIVAFLPRASIFAESNELLRRLSIFAGGVLALAVVFTRTWARATIGRDQQARRIAASEERMRELSSRLLRIQEDERRAISREIHDELGQQATAINLDLNLADRNMVEGDPKPHLGRAIAGIGTLLATLHDFARRVRPAILDDLGLQEALESHVREFRDRTGVRISATFDFPAHAIPDSVADNVFRLIQESLNNVAKHAEATEVDVNVSWSDGDQREIVVSIRDNGRGHNDRGSHSGLGLIGMQERVDLLGGELHIASRPGDGTRVEICLPIGQTDGARAGCR